MKKISGIILTIAIVLSVFSTSVLAAERPNIKRLEGKNRIETSIEISKEAFKGANKAVIVGYNGEVDALTGTILAKEMNAPILISRKDRLDNSIKTELTRLGCEEVYILGGYSVVEKQVENQIGSLGIRVKRINGSSREETAINIAKESIRGSIDRAFLSLGYGVYADALAIGPIAANQKAPLLLTQSKKIGKTTLDFLKTSNIKRITLIGGENAVSKSVENTLKNMGIAVDRVNGSSREETAVNIAKNFVKEPDKLILANGYKYADAVVCGYLAAKENSPILLNQSNKLKDVNKDYLRDKKLDTTILGGSSSIEESVVDHIKFAFDFGKDLPDADLSPNNIKELKNTLMKELEAHKEIINISFTGKITKGDISNLIQDIFSDGSYIGGVIGSVTPTINNRPAGVDLKFAVKYYNSKDQENFIDREAKRITESIIKTGMSDFDKVRAVHDYIVNNTSYSSNTSHNSHSAYTLLKEGKGVCQAYTLATYKLLEQAGIENYYVIGESLGKTSWASHSWNLVKVDGKYYHLDTTKDDPLASAGKDILSYKYFLLSDSKISKTHKKTRDIFPKAVDNKYEILNGASNPFEYKGELFFGNKNDGDKLQAVSLKTLKLRKVSDIRAPYLLVHNDLIYFSNYSDRGKIYRMDTSGNNIKMVNNVHSTNLKLELPYIKFFNENSKKWDRIKIGK